MPIKVGVILESSEPTTNSIGYSTLKSKFLIPHGDHPQYNRMDDLVSRLSKQSGTGSTNHNAATWCPYCQLLQYCNYRFSIE